MEEVNVHCFHVVRAINYATSFDGMESTTPEYLANWTQLDMHTIVKSLRILVEQKHILVVPDKHDSNKDQCRLTKKGRKWVRTQ